jgi:prepilin-type N-terminal cleavage/methylation domain-containing protein
MNKLTQQHNKGFTLIEIMVSVAIFSIIMTTGIGALVSITNSYQVSQKNKQVNDSLNYTLETMTRDLRLGTNFNAGTLNGSDQGPNDGEDDSIGFIASDNRGYIVFRVQNQILKRDRYTTNGGALVSSDNLTNPDEVKITRVRFTVIGTDDLSNALNYQQPLVWIQIQAEVPNAVDGRVTTIQTLVSQRVLDA